jgi:signal transduction histidine kinase
LPWVIGKNASPNETEPTLLLVLDDSRADCRFVCNEVKRLFPQVQVKGVSDAAEFREVLRQERVDICVFDYSLGWDNGIHAAQLARNQWPDCRVILVTAAATDQQIAQTARQDEYIDDFIRKEEHPYRLEFALNAALDRGLAARLLRAHEREHGGLAELVSVASRTTDLGRFFTQVADITARATGAARCRIVALGADGQSLRIMADTAGAATDDCADLNFLVSLAAPAAHDGEARRTAVAAPSPKIRSVLLMDALRPFGFLVVDHAENRPIGDVDLHFLRVTGGIIELIFNRRIQPSDSAPKENFLRTISHEIRTPLNGIVGGCGVVAQILEGDEAQAVNPMLRLIEQSCERLVDTVDSLIELSILQNGSYQPRREGIDLSSLVTQTVNSMFVRAQAKGLTLTFVDHAPGVTVCADRKSLEGAYRAILENAVKFTQSGSITVRLASVEGRVCVEFKDTGIGISAEYLSRLFEPFSQQDTTTSRPYDGLGLGLALAKRYLDLNDVELRVNSTEHAGSTFLTLFPTTPE